MRRWLAARHRQRQTVRLIRRWASDSVLDSVPACDTGCQYAQDVGLAEYSCAFECVYRLARR